MGLFSGRHRSILTEMRTEYPSSTVWYVEAKLSNGNVSQGSAVAIRLVSSADGTKGSKAYLLTCAHVVCGKEVGGDGKFGPVSNHIQAWAPDTAFNDQQAKEVAYRCDIKEPSRNPDDPPDDWVILEIKEAQSATAATTVETWSSATPAGQYRAYGFPNGKLGLTNDIVSATLTPSFEIANDFQGVLQLTGDGTRPGMSGGGIFKADGSFFAGIHRERLSDNFKLHLISAKHIRDELTQAGLTVVNSNPASESLRNYSAHLRNILETDDSFKAHQVDFEYPLQSPNRGELDTNTLSDLIANGNIRGALIHGTGGAGKSACLGRIVRRFLDVYSDKFIPLIVRAGKLDETKINQFLQLAADFAIPADRVLSLFKKNLYLDPTDLDIISHIRETIRPRGILFLVDGINEVKIAAGGESLYRQISQQLDAGDRCIVTARSLFETSTSFWEAFKVKDINDASLNKVLAAAPFSTTVEQLKQDGKAKLVEIMRNPFFLEQICLQGNLDFTTRASLLLGYFQNDKNKRGIGIKDEPLLENVGRAALQMYRKSKKTTFLLSDLLQELGRDPQQLLEGSLDVEGTNARFSHQLKHDFLISYYFYHAALTDEAPARHIWTRDNLDAATFYTEERDPLILTVEQLQPASQVKNDQFLRCVYDWHLGTAISCLTAANDSADPYANESRVFSLEIRTAMLALMGDKRNDPFLHTKKEYDERAKSFQNRHDALFFDQAQDIRALVSLRSSTVPWYQKWQAIFRGEQRLLRDNIFEIAGDDQILAWTIANAVKVPNVGKPEDAGYLSCLLRQILGDQFKQIARWRIVHALGAFGEANYVIESLLDRLNDEQEYVWVRYGAGRSLVEIAARTKAIRRSVLDSLLSSIKKADFGRSDNQENRLRIIREIGRALLFKNVADPQDWIESVVSLLRFSTAEMQKEPRKFAQRWLDDVLIPFGNGEWIGAPLMVATKEQMIQEHCLHWN